MIQVLEDRIPFLIASVKDIQHYVPNSKDSVVSKPNYIRALDKGVFHLLKSTFEDSDVGRVLASRRSKGPGFEHDDEWVLPFGFCHSLQ